MLKWFYRWRLRAAEDALIFAAANEKLLLEKSEQFLTLYFDEYQASVKRRIKLECKINRLRQKLGE